MIEEATISRAADRLKAAAPPGSEVILFGSHARGEADDRSDLDFLVIEPTVENKPRESLRLDNALSGIVAAVDVIVVGRDEYDQWRGTPNNLMYHASREGRLVA